MSKSDHLETVIKRAAGMRPVTFMVPLVSELTLRVMDHATTTGTTTEVVIAEAVRAYFGAE